MARALALMALASLCVAPASAQTFVDAERDGLIAAVGVPPAKDSREARSDLEMVLLIQTLRNRDVEDEAAIDGELQAIVWAGRALGPEYAPARYPAAFALFEAVRADLSKVVDVVKAKGPQRPRPHQSDTRVTPSLSVEGHGSNSWPSGRTAATRVYAAVLTDLFPERRDALAKAAQRSARLRLIGGVHFPSDLVAGEDLSDRFLERLRVNADYRARLAGAVGK